MCINPEIEWSELHEFSDRDTVTGYIYSNSKCWINPHLVWNNVKRSIQSIKRVKCQALGWCCRTQEEGYWGWGWAKWKQIIEENAKRGSENVELKARIEELEKNKSDTTKLAENAELIFLLEEKIILAKIGNL